ncbi:MAG TPA: polysaccharide pyruvyl transferase family protein [Parachlamydiaceae bacterium]|nr:polysaccharide pyruvyl transferase family protein [Parachlamydiaceae bacterium]
MTNSFFILVIVLFSFTANIYTYALEGIPVCYWKKNGVENFGDYISLKLVERIVGCQVDAAETRKEMEHHKLLAIGSILILANNDDVVWGTGMNGKRMDLELYRFSNLDVHAVRGPLTREFLITNFNIDCPEVYGDPALLFPYLFPDFKKKDNPEFDYIIVPHYSEEHLFPKDLYPNVVYPTEPWEDVIRKILNSKFVISSSLHGVVIAEAYGIPARYLRVTDHEPIFKYNDYYLGTNRPNYNYATSIEDAIKMGGEPPFECNVEKLYDSFPFEYWPNAHVERPEFMQNLDSNLKWHLKV